MTIKELQTEAHRVAVEKGWYDPEVQRTSGDLIALAHTELSEAYEELRGHSPQALYYVEGGKPCGFGIELADCIIRLLDTAEHFGLNMQTLTEMKMAYNKTRPHRHGGKKL